MERALVLQVKPAGEIMIVMQLTIGIREYALDLHDQCKLVTIPAER
jgi:hypothetical protein